VFDDDVCRRLRGLHPVLEADFLAGLQLREQFE